MVTVREVLLEPALKPVAYLTRVGAVAVTIACEPTFLPARLTLPVNVRLPPSRLFVTDKTPAAARLVPS